MKKSKKQNVIKYCVQCGEKLEPLDNLDSGEHINPKICIQNLREKIVRMSETFLSGCLVLSEKGDEPFRKIHNQTILKWCDSVEKQFNPRELEDIPRGENPRMIPEQYLAISVGCLKELCGEEEEKPTSSFRITDPNIIRELDSLTPEQVEKLNGFLEDGLKELREKQK